MKLLRNDSTSSNSFYDNKVKFNTIQHDTNKDHGTDFEFKIDTQHLTLMDRLWYLGKGQAVVWIISHFNNCISNNDAAEAILLKSLGCLILLSNQWVSARKMELLCISNGVMTFLHQPNNILSLIRKHNTENCNHSTISIDVTIISMAWCKGDLTIKNYHAMKLHHFCTEPSSYDYN